MFDVSPSEIFIRNVNHEPEDEIEETFLLHSLKSVEEKLNGSKTVSMNISSDLIMFVIKLLNVLTCTLDNEKLIYLLTL